MGIRTMSILLVLASSPYETRPVSLCVSPSLTKVFIFLVIRFFLFFMKLAFFKSQSDELLRFFISKIGAGTFHLPPPELPPLYAAIFNSNATVLTCKIYVCLSCISEA